MTIDIKELRKVIADCYWPTSPVAINEILDRLEAAEKERDKLKELNIALCTKSNSQVIHNARLAEENDTLRAKIEAMEQQVPICRAEDLKHAESLLPTLGLKPENPLYALPGAQQCKNCNGMGDRFDPSGEKIPCDLCESHLEEIRSLVAEAAHAIISGSDFWLSISLAAKKIYALPGAQPAPSEQDASVRKAWARFSHELHRSPDAPYPGMADAFEQHFSQSFIDREWRAEAATWAAAWKAAKRHCGQIAPSVPMDMIADYLVSISAHLARRDDAAIQAAVESEREACKQACEALRGTVSMFTTSKECRTHNNAITCCVKAISARGEK